MLHQIRRRAAHRLLAKVAKLRAREIALERDLSTLLNKILLTIFKFVRADRGVIVCGSCHVPGAYGSPDPLPPMKPETEKPPYYGMPGSKLIDPCDSSQEAFAFPNSAEIIPDIVGLDNDGGEVANRVVNMGRLRNPFDGN